MRDDVHVDELTDGERWEAVLARDARYDGAFVLAVRSTGVYCRPSCSARKPRRENVAFYADADAAEAAGFRPCKRCRPNALSADVEIAERACEFITTAKAHRRWRRSARTWDSALSISSECSSG
jgi:AraC family transcriptional regulator of adaptative response/methylated-DNA-[protein]-cysteine methyltransferase